MATQAKAQLFDLYPKDRAALERIKERLQLSSSALALRMAIRDLARRLDANQTEAPAQDGREGAHE